MKFKWSNENIKHKVSDKILSELNKWYENEDISFDKIKNHIIEEDIDTLLTFFEELEWQDFFNYLNNKNIKIWEKDFPEAIGLIELINNYLENSN